MYIYTILKLSRKMQKDKHCALYITLKDSPNWQSFVTCQEEGEEGGGGGIAENLANLGPKYSNTVPPRQLESQFGFCEERENTPFQELAE